MNSIDEIKKKALEDHIPIIMDDTLETVGQILQEKNILHHIHNEYDGGCFMSTL